MAEITWSSPKGKFTGAGKEISEELGRKPKSTDLNERHPFDIEAIVVLPDHLHAIWTLPEDKQTSQSYVESVDNDP